MSRKRRRMKSVIFRVSLRSREDIVLMIAIARHQSGSCSPLFLSFETVFSLSLFVSLVDREEAPGKRADCMNVHVHVSDFAGRIVSKVLIRLGKSGEGVCE